MDDEKYVIEVFYNAFKRPGYNPLKPISTI
jgi:hypothetical protein